MDWQLLLGLDKLNTNNTERSAFDRDYDRIVFSHPFRRLQDKTQVHPLPEQDFVHNRLTHSLEVSSVGRSLGRTVGTQIISRNTELKYKFSAHDFGTIVASASLAHDIGNPPFGHSGEASISEYFLANESNLKRGFSDAQWQDLVNFEGNAQGFRLLTKTGYQGLKLTKQTLAAFTKYPRPALVEDRMKPRRSQKKFGFFQSEADIFREMANELGLVKLGESQWTRHPLAFLVEAADDICYHIIDLEDGCNLGLVSHNDTVELYAQVIGSQFDRAKLSSIRSKTEQIGLLRAMAIGTLVNQCAELFLDQEAGLLSGAYDISLADEISTKDALKAISKVSVSQIYRSKDVLEIEAAGFNVLNGLLDVFVPAALAKQEGEMSKREQVYFRLLPEDTKMEIDNASNTYEALRSLLDYISGITDTNAMNLYRKIRGTALPGTR